jgi:hypothetical protein
MSQMKFRAHESFFIRKGWLYKGLKNIKVNDKVFTDKKVNPMDTFGIGSSMVKSLRYWMQAVGLTSENNSGTRYQSFTHLGDIIWENDRYMEEAGTLSLLHYNLSKNNELATSWYFFFNKFSLIEFNKEDFVLALDNYIKINSGGAETVAMSSLESDFDCIINTYVSRIKSNPAKVLPENNIDCPFGDIGLIDIVNKKEKIYKKSQAQKEYLHPLILLGIIIDQAATGKEIKISQLLNSDNNIGKVFNLDIVGLINILDCIERLGYIKVIRTAGLDLIKLPDNLTYLDCVKLYYETINH